MRRRWGWLIGSGVGAGEIRRTNKPTYVGLAKFRRRPIPRPTELASLEFEIFSLPHIQGNQGYGLEYRWILSRGWWCREHESHTSYTVRLLADQKLDEPTISAWKSLPLDPQLKASARTSESVGDREGKEPCSSRLYEVCSYSIDEHPSGHRGEVHLFGQHVEERTHIVLETVSTTAP